MKKINKKKIISILIRLAISTAILCYLCTQISFNSLINIYTNIKLTPILIVCLVLACQVALSSLKWMVILTCEKIFVPYLFLLKSYFIGNFISLFLPTSFGGDIYRIYSLKKYNLNTLKNISSVIFDRLTGLFALASIAIVSYFLFYSEYVKYNFLFIYLFSIVAFWMFSSDRMLLYLKKSGNILIKYLTTILTSFNNYKTNKKVLTKSLIISFIFQHNIILIVKLYCVSLNINIDLIYLYMFVPIIYLTEALPISLNGLGVREGAFVLFFTAAGTANEEALAVALLVITMRYLFSMTFGGPLFVWTLLNSPYQTAASR